MKKLVKFSLFTFALFFSQQLLAQRLLHVVNNTACNFEAVQYEYTVFDLTTQTVCANQFYPDNIRGKPILLGATFTLPSDADLLTLWGLDEGHSYQFTILHVYLYINNGADKINILPGPDETLIGDISTTCCPSGKFASHRYYPSPPSTDFDLIIDCNPEIGEFNKKHK